MNAYPEWFKTAIKDGMKALVALRLDNTPAADMITTTRDIWLAALWRTRRWDKKQDPERIHQAFIKLAATSSRWPVPSDFLRALPARKEPRALPTPPLSKAQRKYAHRMTKMINGLITRKSL